MKNEISLYIGVSHILVTTNTREKLLKKKFILTHGLEVSQCKIRQSICLASDEGRGWWNMCG